MGAPLLLADNLFSVLQYPYLGWTGTAALGLTDQTAGAGPAGNEAYRVADGRRGSLDYWLGPTNADGYVVAACYGLPAGTTTPALLPRGANCLFLDRGHNLTGYTVKLLASQDNFTTSQTVFSVVIPAVTGGQPSDALGAVTEEGAWCITFPTVVAAYWKFDVPAMGVGLAPQVVGLTLGMAYQPAALYRPYAEHPSELRAAETMSPVGWRGRGTRAFIGTAALNIRAIDEFDYELCRFTLEELFGMGRPMWIIPDQARAAEAWCGIRPLGQQGFERPQNWAYPMATIQAVEHEPAAMS